MRIRECERYYPQNSLFIEFNKNGLCTLKENVSFSRLVPGYELSGEIRANGFAYDYSDCVNDAHRYIKRKMTDALGRYSAWGNPDDYYDYLMYQEEFKNYRKNEKNASGLNVSPEMIKYCHDNNIDLIKGIFDGSITYSMFRGLDRQRLYECAVKEKDWEKINKFKKNYDDSTKRTAKRIRQIAFNNPWNMFVTFTASSEKVDRYDFEKTSTLLREQLAYLVKKCKRKNIEVKYLVIPEMHKDGAYHFHGMLYVDDIDRFFQYECDTILVNGKENKNIKLFTKKVGFNDVQIIRNEMRATKYITKYISKSIEDANSIRNLFIGAKLLYASYGLKGSTENCVCELENDKHNNYVIDEDTGEIQYINSYNTFIDICSTDFIDIMLERYSADTVQKVLNAINNQLERSYFNEKVQKIWSNGFDTNVGSDNCVAALS